VAQGNKTVLKVIQGQHNKPKAAVHTAEMTGPLKKKKKNVSSDGFNGCLQPS
jgi:hypothetical protein